YDLDAAASLRWSGCGLPEAFSAKARRRGAVPLHSPQAVVCVRRERHRLVNLHSPGTGNKLAVSTREEMRC
ncbi:MAG: hypothetical protein ACKOJF_30290, partial [Planctomycetaceae bacterium]